MPLTALLLRLLGLSIVGGWFISVARAGSEMPAVDTIEIGGHRAYAYAAPVAAKGKPWVWYAPTLQGQVLLIQRGYYVDELRAAGIGIVGIDLGEVRGSPTSTREFTRFYDELVRRGWSPQPILFGQSRGGLMMLAWAMRNPAKVRAFIGVFPVCNLATWGLRAKGPTLLDYRLPEEEIRARIKEFNPLDNLGGLLANKVPMFILHGDADDVVPYDENTGILKERYENGGGPITVRIIHGEGHHSSPAFFENQELLKFVIGLVAR